MYHAQIVLWSSVRSVNLEAHVGCIAVRAEAVALGMGAAEGDTQIEKIVTVDFGGNVMAPCGMCVELDYSPQATGIVPGSVGPLPFQRYTHDLRKDNRTMPSAHVTTEFLQGFADAWNCHDIDALMSFMTEDCVFEASAGPDVCGTRYSGRESVQYGFTQVWVTFPDAHWGNVRHFVFGNHGLSEWTFTGTRADGTRVEVHGCDLFTFRDGKIAVKDSYRKNRTTVSVP